MKTIIIDAGHGYAADGTTEDNGAIANGHTEREFTVSIGQKLMIGIAADPLLKKFICLGIGVNERLTITQHIEKINKSMASSDSLLISLHINSGDASAHGIEGWHPTRGGESVFFAQSLTSSVALNTKFTLRNPAVQPSSANRLGRLGVLDDTFNISCLIELGFISNIDDLAILMNNQDDIVKGLIAGLKSYWRMSPISVFPDVPVDSWYNDAVNKVFKAGIMAGYIDGNFKPQQPITRAEMAVIISRMLKL